MRSHLFFCIIFLGGFSVSILSFSFPSSRNLVFFSFLFTYTFLPFSVFFYFHSHFFLYFLFSCFFLAPFLSIFFPFLFPLPVYFHFFLILISSSCSLLPNFPSNRLYFHCFISFLRFLISFFPLLYFPSLRFLFVPSLRIFTSLLLSD